MKGTSMSAHTIALLKNQIAEVERATGMDMPTLMRLIEASKEVPWEKLAEQAYSLEKSMPWSQLGMSRESFFNWESLAGDSEAVMLMELIEGDDPNALEDHIDNNPVSAKCIIKLVRLAASIKKSELTAGLDDGGRLKGGEVTKARKDAHKEHITKAVEDILSNRQTFDWVDSRIAKFLMDPARAFHNFKGVEIGQRQMTRYIKAIREDYKSRGQRPAGQP